LRIRRWRIAAGQLAHLQVARKPIDGRRHIRIGRRPTGI
jgi:hypothetical protein